MDKTVQCLVPVKALGIKKLMFLLRKHHPVLISIHRGGRINNIPMSSMLDSID